MNTETAAAPSRSPGPKQRAIRDLTDAILEGEVLRDDESVKDAAANNIKGKR
jgi:hypothetical protein